MKGRCVKLEIEINLYLNINVKRDVNLDYKILNNNNDTGNRKCNGNLSEIFW